MIHVTIFSGRTGELRLGKSFYLTLFGGFELTRPTIARRLLARRQSPGAEHATHLPFFLTIFGGGSIKSPTLAAEFIDLRDLLGNGLIDLSDWERALAEAGGLDPACATFTLFGGFAECQLPSEEQEIDGLAIQRHLGNIPQAAGDVLQHGIGKSGSERSATIRRAILTTT